MTKYLKDALTVVLVTFVVSVILHLILFGEVRWIPLISIILIIFVGRLFIQPNLKRNQISSVLHGGLYFLATTWQSSASFFKDILGTDLLNIIFFLSWATLIIGSIGIISSRKNNFFVKGFITLLISICLSGILTIMILLNESFF